MSCSFASSAVLPALYRRDTNGELVRVQPAEPCPELLTPDEAVRYLRLDLVDIQDPLETLTYYRRQGLLKATQVGKAIRFRRVELDRFLEAQTEGNPR